MVIPGSNMFNKLVEHNQKPPGKISRCPDHHFLGGGFTYLFNVHPGFILIWGDDPIGRIFFRWVETTS